MELGFKSYFQEIEEFFVGLAKIFKSFFAFFNTLNAETEVAE